MCTIKLYTKYGIDKFLPTRQPEFDGFIIQELDLQPTLNNREEYNGQIYMTAVLKQCIIFPQKSGKLTINSGDYDITVVQYDQVNMGYLTVSSPTRKDIKVTSNSASIEIKPLPQPQPDGFTGAVGTFKASRRLIGNNFRTGEAASLVYTISGTGNIKYLKEPDVEFPSEFEVYTPKTDFQGGVKGADVTGTTTIDFTFQPRSVGEFTIGADRFVYFDPQTTSYKTIDLPAISLKAGQGDESTRDIISSDMTDIHPVKQGARPSGEQSLTVHSWLFWSFWLLMLLALTVILIYWDRHRKLSADVVRVRASKAMKMARRRLKTASESLRQDRDENFYSDILSAIWGYVSDKLAIRQSQLSRDNIRQELSSLGASDELIDRTIALIDDTEMARYTPGDTHARNEELLRRAGTVISELDRVAKSSK